MSLNQSIFLAIVQGLTEFLPVSSSGHLVIFQKVLGLKEPLFLFDVLVHVGTLGAILVFFKREILDFIKKRNLKFFGTLLLGMLPAVVGGLFLGRRIEWIFDSLNLVGVSFLVTAFILFSTCLLKKQTKKIGNLSSLDALVIGTFQALSLLPGISRSGATISAGLWRRLERESAFDFSILLGALAIFGAFVFEIRDLASFSLNGLVNGVLGMIIAGIVGYFSLKMLKDFVKKGKLFWFGFYCALMGLVVLWFECVLKF